MKYVSFHYQDDFRFGVWVEEKEMVLDCTKYYKEKGEYVPSLLDFIKDKKHEEIERLLAGAEADNYFIPCRELTFKAPIIRPTKNIFCVGKNYRDHAIEMGSEKDIPKHPMIFTKAPTSIAAGNEVLSFSRDVSSELDYEGELAIIIGENGRAISREEAMDFVFGYTILNDITARDLQKKHGQFFLGKSLDQSCPMGPAIVHSSAMNNPHHLSITTEVNGEVRQDGNTSDLIFDIPELISVLSKGMTLEAGDIIATGTPSGVGKGFHPPRFLRNGDRVTISIEGIGLLENEISIG